MHRLSLAILFLFLSNPCNAFQGSFEQRLDVAKNLNNVKILSKTFHKKADQIFDLELVKSDLRYAHSRIIGRFRKEYEIKVDLYLKEEDIRDIIAVSIASKLSLEQLNNQAAFYKTDLGLKMLDNLASHKTSIAGFSKKEKQRLVGLWKKHDIQSLITVVPEALNLVRKDFTLKVEILQREYLTLHSKYLALHKKQR